MIEQTLLLVVFVALLVVVAGAVATLFAHNCGGQEALDEFMREAYLE